MKSTLALVAVALLVAVATAAPQTQGKWPIIKQMKCTKSGDRTCAKDGSSPFNKKSLFCESMTYVRKQGEKPVVTAKCVDKCDCAETEKCAGNRKAGFKCVAKRVNPCADCATDVEHCKRKGKKCLRKPNKCAAAKCAANQMCQEVRAYKSFNNAGKDKCVDRPTTTVETTITEAPAVIGEANAEAGGEGEGEAGEGVGEGEAGEGEAGEGEGEGEGEAMKPAMPNLGPL